jgi:hypothetical protein
MDLGSAPSLSSYILHKCSGDTNSGSQEAKGRALQVGPRMPVETMKSLGLH